MDLTGLPDQGGMDLSKLPDKGIDLSKLPNDSGQGLRDMLSQDVADYRGASNVKTPNLFEAGERYPTGILKTAEDLQRGKKPDLLNNFFSPTPDPRGSMGIAQDLGQKVLPPTALIQNPASHLEYLTLVGKEFIKNLPFSTMGGISEFANPSNALIGAGIAALPNASIPAPQWIDNAIKGFINFTGGPFAALNKAAKSKLVNSITDEIYGKVQSRTDELKQNFKDLYGREATEQDIKDQIKSKIQTAATQANANVGGLTKTLFQAKAMDPLAPLVEAPKQLPFGKDLGTEYQKAMVLPRGQLKPTEFFSPGTVVSVGGGNKQASAPIKAPNNERSLAYTPLLQQALAQVPAAMQPNGQPLDVSNLNDSQRQQLFKQAEYKMSTGGNDQSVIEHLTQELQPKEPTVWVISHHQNMEDAATTPIWDAQKLENMTIAEYAFNQKQMNLQRQAAGLEPIDLAKSLTVSRTVYKGQKVGIEKSVREAILREYARAKPGKIDLGGLPDQNPVQPTPPVPLDIATQQAGDQANANLQVTTNNATSSEPNANAGVSLAPGSQSQPIDSESLTVSDQAPVSQPNAEAPENHVEISPEHVHEGMRIVENRAVSDAVDQTHDRQAVGVKALELAQKLGRKPSQQELAKAMGTTVQALNDIILNRKAQADHLIQDRDKGFTSDDWKDVTITENSDPIELTTINDILQDWRESLSITSLEQAIEEEAGQSTRDMRSKDAKSMFKKKMDYAIGSKEHAERAGLLTPAQKKKIEWQQEQEQRRLAGLKKMKDDLANHRPYLMERYLKELKDAISKIAPENQKIANSLIKNLSVESTPAQISQASNDLQKHIYDGIKKADPMETGDGIKGGIRVSLPSQFLTADGTILEPGEYVLHAEGQSLTINGAPLDPIELAKMVANDLVGVDATDFYKERGNNDHDAWLYKLLSPIDEGGPSVGLSIKGVSGKKLSQSFDGQERQSPMGIVLRIMRKYPLISNFHEFGLTTEDIKAEESKKNLFKIPDKAKEELFSAYQYEEAVRKIAQQDLQPIFEDVLEHIRTFLKEQPKPKGVKVDKKKQEQESLNVYGKLMASASAQILVQSGDVQNWGWSGHATGSHQPGSKNPSDEVDAYVARVQQFYKIFNIPPQDQIQESDLRTQRTPVFWDLLIHPNVMNSDRLQRAIIFYKAQIEQPLLDEEMRHGIYQHNDIWKMIREGYQKKAFTPMGEQSTGSSDSPGGYGTGSIQRPQTAFRTYEEFVHRAPFERWVAVDDFFNNGHQYIIEALRGIKQAQLLRELSILRRPASTIEFTTPELANIWKNNPADVTFRQVEYQTSPAIIETAKHLTALGHPIDPMGVLQELDYVEGNKSDGLDKWYRGSFEPPFIYKQLNETIKMVYKKRTSFDSLNVISKALMYMRHFLTINPVDNYGPWVAMAMMERPAWQVIPYYAYSLGVRMPMAIMEGATKIGPQIWEGNYSSTRSGPKYKWMKLFQEEGSTASAGFSSFLANIIDKNDRGIFPQRQGRFNNWNDYLLSVGGIGTAIFERMMGDDIYYAMEKIAESKVQQGWLERDAARYAAHYMNTAAWSLNRSAFNDEGLFLQLMTISRNFAVVPFRIMSIMNYNTPVTGALAKRAGMYNLKTGASRWTNPFTAADIPERMLGGKDGMSSKYWKNLGMLLFWMYFSSQMLQLAMSYMDDDKTDEHGEIGSKLGLGAKKRWMINNPTRYKGMIRSTNFDVNGKRAYWDYGMFKIINNIFDIASTLVDPIAQSVTGHKSIDTGKGVVAFAQSKKGIIFTFEDILNNINTSGPNRGNPVWDPYAPESEQWDNVGRIMHKAGLSVTPIGTGGLVPGTDRQTTPLQDPAADAFQTASSFLGVNEVPGPPEGGGMTATAAQLMEDKVNSFKFKQQETFAKEGNMTDTELRKAVFEGKATGQAVQDRMFKKINPVMYFKTKNQKALFESQKNTK